MLDLREVLSFSLGPLPWSLATPQGAPNKTTKSALLPLLESHGVPVQPNQVGRAAVLVDAMADIQAMSAPSLTFRDLAGQILRSVLAAHPRQETSRYDFVTDQYWEMSIKMLSGVSEQYMV